MRRLSSAQCSPALILVLLLFCCPLQQTSARTPDLKVEDYCRLTITLMELSVSEWRERIPAAEQNKSDRKKFQARLEEIAKKYSDLQNESYRQFGTDHRDYLTYTTAHAAEIESYLEDNPKIKDEIDSLKNQIDTLIGQFESITSSHREGERQ
jgi:FtsZ-binding cell division protein ZapB